MKALYKEPLSKEGNVVHQIIRCWKTTRPHWGRIYHSVRHLSVSHRDSVNSWYGTSVFWDQEDKNGWDHSPTICANLSELFRNNELIACHDTALPLFAFGGANLREQDKMAAYLITGVKRLWRRQKSRTPWKRGERERERVKTLLRKLDSKRGPTALLFTLDMTSCMSLLGW